VCVTGSTNKSHGCGKEREGRNLPGWSSGKRETLKLELWQLSACRACARPVCMHALQQYRDASFETVPIKARPLWTGHALRGNHGCTGATREKPLY
jgi:hypothetical protein